ncbi:YIP1 family protein [Candidatus Woesearchaeota archaeon]|nr:YIP1 family protein [Candidatus Woesearchaeota archaeon]
MIENFVDIIIKPKETTTKILKKDLSWGKIFIIILILVGFNLIFSLINSYIIFGSIPVMILNLIMGIPSSIVVLFVSFFLFHISSIILGGKGKFRRLCSVLSFVYIIGVFGSILGLIQVIFLRTEFAAIAETRKMMDLSNPVYITFGILGVLLSAVLSYYAHYAIKENYNFTKARALVAAYIPFVLGIMYTAIILFISSRLVF